MHFKEENVQMEVLWKIVYMIALLKNPLNSAQGYLCQLKSLINILARIKEENINVFVENMIIYLNA